MFEDKQRWNEKYQTCPMPSGVAGIVTDYYGFARGDKALDIACGRGRNTHFLASHGFHVDAVDFSDYALSCVEDADNITKIECDLDTYVIDECSYDLIVNCYYLDRRLLPYIKAALKPGGVVIFETYIEAYGDDFHQPSNPDYVLRVNELLHAFIGLDIIYYEEREDLNLRGERVKIASLVAKRHD